MFLTRCLYNYKKQALILICLYLIICYINFIDEKNINTCTSLIESDKIGVNINSIF